jgi:dCTP deaminase
MAFWSTEKFHERGPNEKIVAPFDPTQVKHGAYELAVGPEVSITSDDQTTKRTLDQGEPVIIPPGQFGLALSEEIVSVPNNAIGFISIRASIKFQGLVNVSGFHVDPGFSGRLKFSVYNAGSRNIVVSRGDRIFMFWLSDLDRSTQFGYGGQRSGQNEITSTDLGRMQGKVASPAQLQKDLQDLAHSVTNLKWMLGVLIALAVSLLVAVILLPFRSIQPQPVFVVPEQRAPQVAPPPQKPTPPAPSQPSSAAPQAPKGSPGKSQ